MKCGIVIVLAMLGCGGSTPSPKQTTTVAPPVEAAIAACPTEQSFVLADGKFRCRELPFDVEFPAGSTIQRVDNEWITWFSAKLDVGALAVIVLPKLAVPTATLAETVERVVSGALPGSTTKKKDAAAVEGASEAVAFSIASQDGGSGEVRGYLVGQWIAAVIVGGHGELATLPDRPVGAKFLGSFRARVVGDGLGRLELKDGARIEIPVSAWPKPQKSTDLGKETLSLRAFRLLDREGFLGVREMVPEPLCARLAAARDDNIESEVRLIFSDEPIDLRGVSRAKLGTASASLDVVQDGMNEAAYIICDGKSLVQVSVFGKQPHAELRVLLDRIAKSFVGAR